MLQDAALYMRKQEYKSWDVSRFERSLLSFSFSFFAYKHLFTFTMQISKNLALIALAAVMSTAVVANPV